MGSPKLTKFKLVYQQHLIYKNGKMHDYYFGLANKESKEIVNSETIFELGSVTKTFTGLLLAQRVDAGEVRLNDDLDSYIKDSNRNSNDIKKITLIGLATFTSGLPYNARYITYDAADTSENERYLAEFMEAWVNPYPQGVGFIYSNIGYSILGKVIADHDHKPLVELFEDDIFKQLNMKNSFLTIPEEKNDIYAQGYACDNTQSRTPQAGMLAGAWAIKSSAEDMSRYLHAALGLDDVPDEIRSAMKIAQTGYFNFDDGSEIGFAWSVFNLGNFDKSSLLKFVPLQRYKRNMDFVNKVKYPKYTEHALIEKTGATDGFRAYIGVVPDEKVGVVILVNKFICDNSAIKHARRELILEK